MKLTKSEQAKRLHAYALANYDKGFDHIIECFTLHMIEKHYCQAETYAENLKRFKYEAKQYNDYARDIRATAF